MILQHLTMLTESECNGVCGGGRLGEGGRKPSKDNVLHVTVD